jgi:hypothetical protein
MRVVLLAQAEIGKEPQDFDGLLPGGIRSVSSVLRPDVTMGVVAPKGVGVFVLDAKRRSAATMDPRDAAEAASKYVWGIRLGGSASEPDDGMVHVTRALLATTAVPPLMISAQARIVGLRVLPSLPVIDLRKTIKQSLDDASSAL